MVTYWEILEYLDGENLLCVNTLSGHNRHVRYIRGSRRESVSHVFEPAMYCSVVKLFHIPNIAFSPSLENLIIKKCKLSVIRNEKQIDSITQSIISYLIIVSVNHDISKEAIHRNINEEWKTIRGH